MKKGIFAFGVAVLLAAGSILCAAQDKGYWRAASSTANQITGDLTISQSKLTINFVGYSLASIHSLTTAEAGAAFDIDVDAPGSGNLYRLKIPGDKRFLHHNTLCGSEDTEWMATYVQGHTMHVALFSGTDAPVLTAEALANSSNVCGLFSYER